MATYTKGSSGDTFDWQGNMTVAGTFIGSGSGSYILDATEEAIDIDAGTTDHTGAQLIDVNLDVNSANCKVINMDIDVGTALSTGEKVYGTYVNIDGAAGDHAESEFAAFYATSANTTASTHNNGVELGGTFDTGVLVGAVTTADGISITGTGVDGIHVSGAQSANAVHISGNQAVAVLVDVDDDLATGISYSVDTGKTVTTGISMTGLGTVTTGIDLASSAMTTGVSIGLTGKTYTAGILLGTGGGTITTGMSFLGAMTAGINFGSASAIGTLINATGACAALATRGIFIGEDSNSTGSAIKLNGAAWATSQGNAFYSDDGGVAATGYTETMTVRHLSTTTVASGDVSFTPLHTDLYLNASYTGIGGLSSIWGNTTIASGKTVDTSGGLGDVGGATFGIDIVGILAASSHACGCSVGVGGSGTKNGILSGFRVRGATGTVDWDAFLSIEDGDGSWTSMTTAGSGKTPSLGTAGPTGSDSAPAYWMNIYIGTTKYYFPVWVAT